MRKLLSSLVVAGAVVSVPLVASSLFAQGRPAGLSQFGRGGGRAPAPSGAPGGNGLPANTSPAHANHAHGSPDHGKLGRSGPGIGRASDAQPGAAGPVRSPAGSGLNHGLKGRSNAEVRRAAGQTVTDATDANGQPITNAERIRDRRVDQAEHLRKVGEANGNARLGDAADRMDASARRNFDRQTGVPRNVRDAAPEGSPHSPNGSSLVPPNGSAPPISSAPPTGAAAAETKSSWVPSWLRRKKSE